MASQSDARVTPGTAVLGATAGVVAFALGLLVSFFAGAPTAGRVLRSFVPLRDAGAHLAPAWKVGAWLFYDAHFVGTRVGDAGMVADLVSMAGVEFLYLVPPVLLLLAGGGVALLVGAADPRRGLVAGTTVAVGYLLAVVVLLPLVGFAGIGPVALRAAVVAGIVYPVAFGGAGGALVGVVRADRRPGESLAGVR